MWSLFADLLRNVGSEHTIVVMDAEEVGKTRRYSILPSRLLAAWGGSLLAAGVVVGLVFVFTPLRTQIPGYGTKKIKESARRNTLRLQSLQDSLAAQRQYVRRLRQLITGRIDSMPQPTSSLPRREAPAREQSTQDQPSESGGSGSESTVHEAPAIAPSGIPLSQQASSGSDAVASELSFPLSPPVSSGFPTRDFNAGTGHYGIDVAVSEGEFIRAVGNGFVVWADWTQDGGYTIAVQHADGYLSVYKHNGRLLKRLGDRVRAQEPIALSGNTGAITTGPHLHFELWRNGLAQGPKTYIAGW